MNPLANPSPSPVEPPRVESAWLVECFRQGDERAAEALFERYFSRLTALVRARLSTRLQSRLDADDVVQSTYRSFFVRASAGQFELDASGDLWRLLARMALHKLSHQVGRHTAEKRMVSAEERLSDASDIASREPSPDEAAAIADELEYIMRSLTDTERRTLELRLQGELLEAIAAELGQSERTVRRTLAHVREIMRKRLPEAVSDKKIEPSEPGSVSGTALAAGFSHGRRSAPRHSTTPVASAIPLKVSGIGLTPPGSPTVVGSISDVATLDYADFLLKQHIGEGLTGKVYRAWWKSRGREVAVKYLRRAHLNHPDRVERFCEEAALVAGLQHPNIAAVHGLGRAPHGGYFIVLDWIDGPDLQLLLDQSRHDSKDRLINQSPSVADAASIRADASGVGQDRDFCTSLSPLAVENVTRWMTDTARAVQHAHESGLVHCDLKPSNLLLAPDGRVVLTDFGFARRLTANDRHSVDGGTLAFMAPEQLDDSFGEIGPRTDIYGWGAVLYILLTGESPHFKGSSAELTVRFPVGRRDDLFQSLHDAVPERLRSTCALCLNPNPLARPASMIDVLAMLEQI